MLTVAFILSLILFNTARRIKAPIHPNKVFALFWSVQLLAFIPFSGLLYIKPHGVIYIIIGTFCVLLGGTLSKGNTYPRSKVRKEWLFPIYSQNKFLFITFIVWLLGLYSPVYFLLKHGVSIFSLFDFSTLLETNNEMSIERYSGGYGTSSFTSQILSVFFYLSPLTGGFFVRILNHQKNKWCYLVILPSLLTTLTQGVKMPFITFIMLFVVGMFVSSLLFHHPLHVKLKNIIYASIGVICFFAVLILSMMFRIGRFDTETFQIVSYKFISYAFGHIPAFTQVFDSYLNDSNITYTYGMKSFMGITNYLGLTERVQGLYTKALIVAKDGQETNVYSIFRIILDDFGIILGLFWLLLIGIVNNQCYKNVVRGRNLAFSSTILAVTYFVTFWSFATCALVYTSYIVVFVLFFFVVRYTVKHSLCKICV